MKHSHFWTVIGAVSLVVGCDTGPSASSLAGNWGAGIATIHATLWHTTLALPCTEGDFDGAGLATGAFVLAGSYLSDGAWQPAQLIGTVRADTLVVTVALSNPPTGTVGPLTLRRNAPDSLAYIRTLGPCPA
jgi:hypothetical protein